MRVVNFLRRRTFSRLARVEARQSRLINAQVTYIQLEFVENGERLGAIASMCLPNQRWGGRPERSGNLAPRCRRTVRTGRVPVRTPVTL